MDSRIRILVAEHDAHDVEMIDNELKRSGIDYVTKTVENEAGYKAAIKNFLPNVILCDYTFPSFDGPTAFEIREQLAPETPFILVSGTIGDENSIELIKKGVTDFVLKDKIFTLETKLARALKEAKERKEKSKIEQELKQSEARLVKAQAIARIGSWEISLIDLQAKWSEGTYNIFEVDHRDFQVTHTAFLRFIHPDDAKEVNLAFQASFNTTSVNTIEHRIITPAGLVKHVEQCWQIYFDEKRKPLTAVGTCQDITERKNNEAEINRAYVERNLVLESIDDGFFASDKNSLVTYWNRKAEILLGVKKEDVLGKNPHEMFADSRSRVFHDNYQKALRENTTVRFEGFSHRTNKWFAVSAFAFDNGLSVYFRDDTERKKDEEKLKASELRYRQIVETAQEGIWLIDENHITTFVNSKLCEIFEYTEAEMIGKDIFYFMNEEGQALAAELMERKKDGFAGQSHFKYISKSGNEIWTNLSANPLFDEKGTYKGSLAMVTDITQSKKAEKKDQFQAALLNTIGQAAIATDMQGRINFWNKAASALYGWTEEEVMGNNILEITPIQQTKEQAEQIMQELLHGKSWSGEFIVRRKDGSEFPAYVTNAPIYDQQQQLIGIIGLSSDITRRKQAELQLKESNERYQLISQATNDMVWDWDLVTGKVYRNKEGWKKIFRTSDSETEKEVTDDWAGKIHPDDKDKISILTNQIRKSTEGFYEMECRVMRNDGTVAFIHDRGTIVRNQQGKATRVIGATQDITERKKAEAALLYTLNEKNTILESIGDGFFAADDNWTVTYWNNHAEEMLGVSKEQIVGKRLWDVFKDSIDSESYKQYHRAIASNEVIQFEDFFKPSNKWYEVSAYPSVPGVAVYFKDITDRKRSEIQLNQLNANLQRQAKELAISNAELEQFAYVASHDLQEPLRMITSFLTQLEKKYGDVLDDKGKKYIDFAVDGAKRMRRIILDLLEYSRVGRIDSKQEIIDLNELVDEIQILFRKQIQEKNAVITSASLPHIPGNRPPIRQVFQNLIGNALKFVGPDQDAKIDINSVEYDDHWQFAVRDNGIGIDQEYFEKIFIIFQRLHSKDEFSGTGMGLAITKKILENEGGKIWVESEEGKGSTFHFTIKKALTDENSNKI